MSTSTPEPADTDNRGSMTLHLHGPQAPVVKHYPRGTSAHTPEGYGSINIERGVGGLDLTVFVHDAEQAEAIAEAFASLAAKFRADTPPPPDAGPCRICGTQTRYVESFQGVGKPDARALIHTDAGIRLRDHSAELVPAKPDAAPVHNSFPGLTRAEAAFELPGTLHADNVTVALDAAEDEGRWDNPHGYVTHDPARGHFTIYAYEPVAASTMDGRPLYAATRDQLDRLVAAGDPDAIAEQDARTGSAE